MATIRRYGERTPQEAAAHVRRHRENLSETRRLQGTPGVIAATARELFERDGVRKTTVTAIAREANVTRELAYYHFGNKNGIIEAVLDDYAEDLVESVIAWNESRAFGDTAGSLRTCVHTFRYALYDAFDVRATVETVDCLNDHIVAEYAAYHQIEIHLVYEMFCLVIFGLVGLVKVKPTICDEDLMKVVEQALRLDMEPVAPRVAVVP